MKRFIFSLFFLLQALICVQVVNAEWVDTTSDGEFKYYIDRASVNYVSAHNPAYYLARIKLEAINTPYYIFTNIYVYKTNAFEFSIGEVYHKLNGQKIQEVNAVSVTPIKSGSVIDKLANRIVEIDNNQQQYIKNERLKKAQEEEKKQKQEKIKGKVIGAFTLGIVAFIVRVIYYKYKNHQNSSSD